jgi:hypothetical protein
MSAAELNPAKVRRIVRLLSKRVPSNMSAIGSLVFCTDCGNLLDAGDGEENAILVCDVCGARCKGTTASSQTPFHLVTPNFPVKRRTI